MTPKRNPTQRLARYAKQAAVAAFVHQAKTAYREEDDERHRHRGEPGKMCRRTRTAAHQRSAKGTRVVKTCANPLLSSDLPYRPIMAHFCCIKQSLDSSTILPPTLSKSYLYACVDRLVSRRSARHDTTDCPQNR